jgi:hypothetical protein
MSGGLAEFVPGGERVHSNPWHMSRRAVFARAFVTWRIAERVHRMKLAIVIVSSLTLLLVAFAIFGASSAAGDLLAYAELLAPAACIVGAVHAARRQHPHWKLLFILLPVAGVVCQLLGPGLQFAYFNVSSG